MTVHKSRFAAGAKLWLDIAFFGGLALASLFALWLATRYGFDLEANVNIARRHWFGWEADFAPYGVYIVALFAIEAAVFYAVERLCRATRARGSRGPGS